MHRQAHDRELARDLVKEYLARPITIQPTGKHLWVISGRYRDGKGGGVLAWCVDRTDAAAGLLLFEATQDYRNLSIHEYVRN